MEFSKQEKVSKLRYKVHFRKYVKNGPTFQGCTGLVPTLSFIKMAQGNWLNGIFFSFGSPCIFSRCVNNGSLYLPPVLWAWCTQVCSVFIQHFCGAETLDLGSFSCMWEKAEALRDRNHIISSQKSRGLVPRHPDRSIDCFSCLDVPPFHFSDNITAISGQTKANRRWVIFETHQAQENRLSWRKQGMHSQTQKSGHVKINKEKNKFPSSKKKKLIFYRKKKIRIDRKNC